VDSAVEKKKLRWRPGLCGGEAYVAVDNLALRQISGVCGGENDIAVEQEPPRRFSALCGDTRSRRSAGDSYEDFFPTFRCFSRYARISARDSSWVVAELGSLGVCGSGKSSAPWGSSRKARRRRWTKS